MRMSVAPDRKRGALGNAPIALPQRHLVAPCQIDQLLQRAMTQPRVGRMRNRFGLHGRVDHDPFEIDLFMRDVEGVANNTG